MSASLTHTSTWKIARWVVIVGIMAVTGLTANSMLKGSLKEMYTLDTSQSTLLGSKGPAGAKPKPNPNAALPKGPVLSGKAKAISDFAVLDGVVKTGTSGVTLTDTPSSLILAFDPIPGNPECFATLSVRLNVMENVGTSEIGLFPSSVTHPRRPKTGDKIPGDMQLSPEPLGRAAFGSPGTADIDILPNYKKWFQLGRGVNDPLTFTIAPSEAITPGNSVTIATSEVADHKPELIWTGKDGCK